MSLLWQPLSSVPFGGADLGALQGGRCSSLQTLLPELCIIALVAAPSHTFRPRLPCPALVPGCHLCTPLLPTVLTELWGPSELSKLPFALCGLGAGPGCVSGGVGEPHTASGPLLRATGGQVGPDAGPTQRDVPAGEGQVFQVRRECKHLCPPFPSSILLLPSSFPSEPGTHSGQIFCFVFLSLGVGWGVTACSTPSLLLTLQFWDHSWQFSGSPYGVLGGKPTPFPLSQGSSL